MTEWIENCEKKNGIHRWVKQPDYSYVCGDCGDWIKNKQTKKMTKIEEIQIQVIEITLKYCDAIGLKIGECDNCLFSLNAEVCGLIKIREYK